MRVCKSGYATSARCTREESYLHKIRLVHILKRDGLFADGSGESFKTDRTAVVKVDNCFEHSAVGVVKSKLVDLKTVKSIACYFEIDISVSLYLGIVAYALEQAVGDTGSSTRTGCDLKSTVLIDLNAEYACASRNADSNALRLLGIELFCRMLPQIYVLLTVRIC